MEAFASGTAAGILANSVTLVLEKLTDEWRNEAKARILPLNPRWVRGLIDREPAFDRPDGLMSRPSQHDSDAVMRYLMSLEAANLVADLVAARISGATNAEVHLQASQCHRHLLFFGVGKEAALEAAEQLTDVFDRLSSAAAQAIRSETGSGETDTQQRINEARNRIGARHAERVENQLALLVSLLDQAHIDLPSLETKLRRLKVAVAGAHSTLTPPNVDASRRVPIAEIFVPTTVHFSVSTESFELVPDDSGKTITAARRVVETIRSTLPAGLPALWRQCPHSVVLGTPGAGKTTLTEYIAKLVAEDELEVDPRVAIPVVVREHANPLGLKHGIDFIGAIKSTCLDRYQTSLTRLEIEYLVSTARLALIVDGLDELLATQDRQRVVQSLEAFCQVYPDCYVLATSRVVGYEQAPLRKDLFPSGEIQPLTEVGIRTYAMNWFGTDPDLAPAQRDSLVESFMEDSSPIGDLRQNALLLSLMCTLYRHERQLPRNRPQVYEACAKLLFDTWDRRRQLRPKFDFDAHVPGAVQHLARYIFDDQTLQGGVMEPQLVEVAAAYFREWQYTSDVEARRAAQEFIDFCKGRAWILTDTGSTSSSVPLLGFAHRTFLEYFTAVEISRSLSVDQLLEFFRTHPQDAAWNVICQILLQLAPQKQRGLENDLITQIHAEADSLPPTERDISLSVALQSLAGVPFKPGTVQVTVGRALDNYLSQPHSTGEKTGAGEDPERLREKYWLTGSVIAVENHGAAATVVDRRLNDLVTGGQSLKFAVSHLVDFHLVQGVRPASLRGLLDVQHVPRLSALVRDDGVAWLSVCGLLLGLPEPLSGASMAGAHFGAAPSGRGVIVKGPDNPWGGRRLPAPAEVLIWCAANSREGDEEWLQNAVAIQGVPALAALGKSTTVTGYSPHWPWHSIGAAVVHRTAAVGPPDMDLPYETLLPLVFTLTELYAMGASGEELRRRMQNLADRDWGALAIVGACIGLRYKVETPDLTPNGREFLRGLGLDDWCNGKSVRPAGRRRGRSGR